MIYKAPRDVKIVVSMTAMSHRLGFLPEVLSSLQRQTRRPDQVLLWLSNEPFVLDQGVSLDDLPLAVRQMEERGEVEIRFTRNIGPHRKLLPTLRLFQEKAEPPLIVTADDDTYYPARWLECLLEGFSAERTAVCFRARRIKFDGDKFEPYARWPLVLKYEECLNYRLAATGCDGFLVHPHLLDPRIFDPDLLHLSQTRSDIWIAGALMSVGTPLLKLSHTRLLQKANNPEGSPVESNKILRLGASDWDPSNTLHLYNAERNDAYIRRTLAFFASDCATVREFIATEAAFPSRPPFPAQPATASYG